MTRRLDAVLRVRVIREQLARADIAAEQQALARHLESEERAWAALQSISNPGAVTARQLAMHHARRAAALSTAERSGERVQDARRRVGTATALWHEAAQRLDGAERLQERHVANARAEAERAEYAELDDLVVMRWPTSATTDSTDPTRPSAPPPRPSAPPPTGSTS